MGSAIRLSAGDRFGSLTVVAAAAQNGPHVRYRCGCDCGQERVVRATALQRGRAVDCARCAAIRGARIRSSQLVRISPLQRAITDALYIYAANANRRGLVFDLTRDQFASLATASCHYCGQPPEPLNGVDRVDNSAGYAAANCVACCSICNMAKRDMSVADFLEWARRLHQHQSSRGKKVSK